MKTLFKLIVTVGSRSQNICIQRKEGKDYRIVTTDNLNPEDKKTIISTLNNLTATLCEEEPTKVCPKCHRTLTISHFYKKLDKDKHNVGSYFCKECTIKNSQIQFKAKPEELRKLESENYRLKRTIKELRTNQPKVKKQKVVQTKKQCRDCIYYKNCFTDTYYQESNFAETCKKYKIQ